MDKVKIVSDYLKDKMPDIRIFADKETSLFAKRFSTKMVENIVGGRLLGCELDDSGMDHFLVLTFEDGSELRIRYDYIYDWTLKVKGVLIEQGED